MLRSLLLLCAATALLVGASVAFSQDKDPLEDGKPVAEHGKYDWLEGKWQITLKLRDADGNWFESSGTAEYRWILDRRFMQESVKCKLDDTPYEWLGILGYDRDAKQYTATWFDNLDITSESARGLCDEKTGALTFEGERRPTGEPKVEFSYVLRRGDGDSLHMEVFEPANGVNRKVLEGRGKRIK